MVFDVATASGSLMPQRAWALEHAPGRRRRRLSLTEVALDILVDRAPHVLLLSVAGPVRERLEALLQRSRQPDLGDDQMGAVGLGWSRHRS
jgi:hypothetical protein